MIYLILLAITFIVQLFAVSWYIMSESVIGLTKALKYKLLCSGVFIIDAILCAAIKDSFTTEYFYIMLLGFVLCFIGDTFLNITKKWGFPLGMAFFFCGHAFYCCAFSVELQKLYGVAFFNTIDIIVWCAVFAAFIALSFNKKLFDFKGLKPAILAYGAVIILMAVKAVHLGVLSQLTGISDNQSLSFTLIAGSLGFIISDAILLFMYFGDKNTRKNSLLNAYTYFFSQMLLACTILFIGG